MRQISISLQFMSLGLWVLTGLFLGLTGFAHAGQKNFGLVAGAISTVTEIVDGDTVFLANGEEVRLTGIQAPKLPLGRKNFRTWPFAETAKQAISDLTLGKQVQLFYDGRRQDRHGRTLAHLQLATLANKDRFQISAKTWVQAAMIADGLARVYSFSDNRRMTPHLLSFETQARRQGLNIWRHRFYRIRTPENVDRHYRTFQLVEGRVLNAASVRRRLYLNFGDNWRTDFTIQVAPKARRLFDRAGLGPDSYKNRRVRVRGWVDRYNGPMIRITHPEQIEVLAE